MGILLQVGDVLHFRIKELETLFGDMLLDVHSITPAERRARILEELQQAAVRSHRTRMMALPKNI